MHYVVILDFVLQKGYWELTPDLGQLINVDLDNFANVFLKNKGIQSLGEHFLILFQAFKLEIAFLFLIKLTSFSWDQYIRMKQ